MFQRIAIVAVGLVVLFLASVWLDRLFSGLRSDVQIRRYGRGTNAPYDCVIIYLPGILVDGDRSVQPLIETWQQYGDVMAVTYEGDGFNAAKLVAIIGTVIKNDILHKKVVLVGGSMGGLLSLDVVSWLRDHGGTDKTIKLIAVDSPSGSQNMLAGGNIGAPVLRFLPFGRLYSWMGAGLIKMMLVPPKDENIEPGLDRAAVKREGIAMMSQATLSSWRDQLVYIASRKQLSASDFDGIDAPVVYMRCDRNNETVSQPIAANTWSTTSKTVMVVGVDSTHCGFLERQATWRKAFASVLSGM